MNWSCDRGIFILHNWVGYITEKLYFSSMNSPIQCSELMPIAQISVWFLPSVPDSSSMVLTRRKHPRSFFIESHSSYIFTYIFILCDSIWIIRVYIIHSYVLISWLTEINQSTILVTIARNHFHFIIKTTLFHLMQQHHILLNLASNWGDSVHFVNDQNIWICDEHD